MWSEEVQDEIDRNLNAASAEECVAKAIGGLISGHIAALCVNILNMSYQGCWCDPVLTIDFNERFLVSALERMKHDAVRASRIGD